MPEAEALTTATSTSLHAYQTAILVIVTAAVAAEAVALAAAVAPAERAATAVAVASASSCGIHPLRSSTTQLQLETAETAETVGLEAMAEHREQAAQTSLPEMVLGELGCPTSAACLF